MTLILPQGNAAWMLRQSRNQQTFILTGMTALHPFLMLVSMNLQMSIVLGNTLTERAGARTSASLFPRP